MTEHHPPRLGSTYRPRLKGTERKAVAARLGRDYDSGATIRALAAEHAMSYGTVRQLLLEAGARLRRRGGRLPGAR
ncbi:helix-turn-helix domain-containing protein [Streptomyces alfalfae]